MRLPWGGSGVWMPEGRAGAWPKVRRWIGDTGDGAPIFGVCWKNPPGKDIPAARDRGGRDVAGDGDVFWEDIDVFAWDRSEGTVIPRFVMEHQLKIYPLSELVVHKRRPMTPDGRQALKERVFRWLKEGTIRKVQHPEWVAKAILVKLANGA
ncbi:hypothetical protein Tco_0950321 [Tanacetum coccineum]